MKTNFKFITTVLAFMLCLSAIAFGQGTTGSIEGTVTDANGAVVPNATVTVRSSGSTSGYSRSVTADSNGYINIQGVPPGSYKVTIVATNFAEKTFDASVSVDKATSISSVLQVTGVTGVVEVVADSAVTIDTTNNTVDTNITKRIFEALPSGTQFGSLLKIAPNVRPEALNAGFQIDGASGAENVFVVDGQEVTNFRTGQLNSNNNLPFELLQEVQVKSTGFNAEYGGATGGVINAVTIGGNDEWRGNFGVSFTPGKLQGSPRDFLNRFSTTVAPEYFAPPKDGGTGFFPVASFSGPIVKGKLWFSAIYAPQIQETTRTIDYFSTGNNPVGRTVSQSISYNNNVRTEEMFVRLDAQPSSKFRLYGTFLYNPIVQDGVLPAITEGLSGAPQSVNFGGSVGTRTGADLLGRQGGRQNSNSVNGQATWTPTNYLVLNFRAGRSFLNEKLNSYGLPNTTRFICQAGFAASTTPGSGCTSGFQNIANNFQINFDVSTRTTFDADASLVGINAGGRHNFKFGYQLNRLFNDVDQGYVGLGIVQLFYGLSIDQLTGVNTPTPGNLGTARLQRFGTVGEASSRNQSIFVQDTWQIARRLTLNLGVRFENEIVPNFGTTGSDAIEFGWGDKIAPRLGFAFDLTGDGKTKIFGSYGWFYDRFKYELPRGSFGGDFFRRDFAEILPSRGALFSNYTLGAIIGSNPDPIGGTCPIVGGTGWSVCQFDFRIATNLTGADIFETGAIDPSIEAARQSEYTFGIERELSNNFVLAGRYTHKQVDRAIEDVGVFNAQGSEAYIIGNPGFGLVCEVASTANLPCPKARRDFDAVEIRVDKRATKYFFNASYTWSRLFGNYSGLASSDEFGRSSPNVNRFFDLPMLGFNANGDPDDGPLATDRPHVVKAYGGYTFDWRGNSNNATTVSAFTTFQSGSPLTTIYTNYAVTTAILFGRGDLGRTEMFTETDFSVSHRYKFGKDGRFSFEPFLNIRNLFDERNEIAFQTTISNTDIRASQLAANGCTTCTSEGAVFNTIFNGPGITQFILNYLNNPTTSAAAGRRNDYGLPNTFQAPREVRIGARLFF
ncbi:MAG: carboxypeptidase regulatory-like domain-containing protein [Blastocatellia bacterium]